MKTIFPPTWRRWVSVVCAAAILTVVWVLLHRLHPNAARSWQVLQRFATAVAARPAGAALATAAYAIAGIAFVPITLLATVTLAAFGPWPGLAVAWTGGLISAIASHALGRLLGPRALGWLPPGFEARLRTIATRRPFSVAVIMRLSPVGNFGAFNLLAGVLALPRGPFILGNMLGLVPGLLGLGVVVERARAMVRHPTAANSLSAIAALGLMGALAMVVKRRLRRSGSGSGSAPESDRTAHGTTPTLPP